MKSELDVAQQTDKEFWERINKDGFEWETLSLLSVNALFDLDCGVFANVKHTFDVEMVEHRLVGFLNPFDDVVQVCHHLWLKLVEGKLGELTVEVFEEWRKLVFEEVVVDQHERLHVGIVDKVKLVWMVVGTRACQQNRHRQLQTWPVVL